MLFGLSLHLHLVSIKLLAVLLLLFTFVLTLTLLLITFFELSNLCFVFFALRFVLKFAPTLRTAWAHAYKSVVGSVPVAPHTLAGPSPPAPRWGAVSGPISACIASLTPYGWVVPNPQRWTAPSGQTFVINDSLLQAPLYKAVAASVYTSLWDKASWHYCGNGLESGPDPVSFKLLASLRKQGSSAQAGVLECVLCAGYWFPEMVAEAFPREVSPLCAKCTYQVPASPLHVLWECPSLQSSVDPAIANTQNLKPDVATQSIDYPLWLAAIIRSMVDFRCCATARCVKPKLYRSKPRGTIRTFSTRGSGSCKHHRVQRANDVIRNWKPGWLLMFRVVLGAGPRELSQ